jgi:hypothetical protein
MKSRNTQVFVAPGDEDAALPLEPSPWHWCRRVDLPSEHWALILDFAEKLDPVGGGLLTRLSKVGASRVEPQSMADLSAAEALLRRLSAALPAAPPLVEAPTPEIPEDHPNEEHARMCDAVATAIREAMQAKLPMRAWVE